MESDLWKMFALLTEGSSSIRGEEDRAHHFPTAVSISSSVSPPQTVSKQASLRNWVLGGMSLVHKARDERCFLFDMYHGASCCSVVSPLCSTAGHCPFLVSLTHRDAVSTTASVTITKLNHERGFTMFSASLCVVWGQEGHLCAVGGGCAKDTPLHSIESILHPWEQRRALP